MAIQVKAFVYDHNVENKDIDKWIEKKIEDGWEFVCVLPHDFSGIAWKPIIQVVFKKTV